MKRFGKMLGALVLSATMVIPAGVAFADGTADFKASHIEWIETTTKDGVAQLTAKAFVRNYAEPAEQSRISCAVYDENDRLLRMDMALGKVGNLRANVSRPTAGETVKAFVWTAVGQNPIRMVSTYGSALADIDYELLLDGKSISDYTGNTVHFSKETDAYSIDLPVDSDTRKFVAPRITIASSDNAVSVVVSTVDDTHTKATVRNSAKGESKEYTFTWGMPTGMVMADQFEDVAGNDIIGPTDTLQYKYEQTYTVAEDETKTIALTSNGFTRQKDIIIVVPTDGDKTRDVVVDTSGQYGWETDIHVLTEYNEESGEITFGELLGKDLSNGNINNGYLGTEGPVVLTNFSGRTSTAVFRHLQNSDNGMISDSRISDDRSPCRLAIGATGFAEELVGCNYIVLPSGNPSNATVTFTINRSAKIIMLSPNGSRTVTDGDGNTYAVSALADAKPQVRYTNVLSEATIAFAVAAGFTRDVYVDAAKPFMPWSALYAMQNAGHQKQKQAKAGTVAAGLNHYAAMYEKMAIKENTNLITNLRFAEGITTASDANGTYNGTLQVTTLEMGKQYLSDRTNAVWGSIPEGLELEGAELIMGWQECANHNGNNETTIWSTAGRALYHFEVTRDAEVYVIASASSYNTLTNPILRPSGNGLSGRGMTGMWGNDGDDDTLRPTNSAFGGVSIREVTKYSAGETVTVQANGQSGNTKVMIVVKPFNE